MSISKSIAEWLNGYAEDAEIIDIDQLAAVPEAYALFRSPETIVTPFVNGSRDVSAYYQYVIRRQSQTEAQREENAEWLEDLERWIYAQVIKRNLPTLGKGMECVKVEVTGGLALETQNLSESEYQVMLHINYCDRSVSA